MGREADWRAPLILAQREVAEVKSRDSPTSEPSFAVSADVKARLNINIEQRSCGLRRQTAEFSPHVGRFGTRLPQKPVGRSGAMPMPEPAKLPAFNTFIFGTVIATHIRTSEHIRTW
jgi:hypothetical protein